MCCRTAMARLLLLTSCRLCVHCQWAKPGEFSAARFTPSGGDRGMRELLDKITDR